MICHITKYSSTRNQLKRNESIGPQKTVPNSVKLETIPLSLSGDWVSKQDMVYLYNRKPFSNKILIKVITQMTLKNIMLSKRN